MHNFNDYEQRFNEQSAAGKFRIEIPDITWEQLIYWCNLGHKRHSEVSGLASIQFDQDTHTFKVIEPKVLDEGTQASTEIDPVVMGKAMFAMKDMPNPGKCHWHTHPGMGAFWSGTDMNLIRQMGSQGWMIFLVVNEKREIRAAFYQLVEIMGVKHEIFLDQIPVTIVYPAVNQDLIQSWDTQYDAIKKKYTTHSYHYPDRTNQVWDSVTQQWVQKTTTSKTAIGENLKLLPSSDDKTSTFNTTWDHEGWRWDHTQHQWLYNPALDSTLTTDKEKIKAIKEELLEMDIKYLYKTSPRFQYLYDQAIEKGDLCRATGL